RTHALCLTILLPPPPRSPLFPYTTLFRSVGSRASLARRSSSSTLLRPKTMLTCSARASCITEASSIWSNQFRGRPHLHNSRCQRSEEHTSELQSRGHLVCRLLLERKNDYL